MSSPFNILQIATALKKKERSVQRRAKREGWKHEKGYSLCILPRTLSSKPTIEKKEEELRPF
jgi:hypothetical protein